MAYNRRGRSALEPWEWWRRASLSLDGALLVFLYMVVGIPFGISFLACFVLAAHIWRPIGVRNPVLGDYVPESYPYKIAVFFMGFKAKVRQILSPVSSLGLGPPTEDPDHGLSTGWIPATRLSGYWSLLGAGSLSLLETPLSYGRSKIPGVETALPVWGRLVEPSSVPWWVWCVLGALGWHALIQSCLAVRRFQADRSTPVMGIEPAPATMLSRVRSNVDLGDGLRKSLGMGAIPAAVLAITWVATGLPAVIMLPLAGLSLVSVALVSISVRLQRAYREKWQYRVDRRNMWSDALSFMKDKTPTLMSESELPTLEEWEQTEHDEDEPYSPDIKVATFIFPPSCTFWDYADIGERVRGALEAKHVAIAPIGELGDDGQEQPGTVGPQGFRIWWTEKDFEHSAMLDPDVSHWVREFAIRSMCLGAISDIRGLGHSVLVSCGLMTRRRSKAHLVEVKMVPPPNVHLGNFLDKATAIGSQLMVPWVRVDQDNEQDRTLTILFGDDPYASSEIKWVNPPRFARARIDKANWRYIYHVERLVGASGPPTLIKRSKSTPIVDELLFDKPPGLAYDAIEGKVDDLMNTSGNAYMEIVLGDGRKPDEGSTQEDRVKEESQGPTKFRVITARQDPLNRVFPLEEYRDQVLKERRPNEAQIDWSPGVLANDELAHYSWDDELPHLLIAGSSGMGKSVLENSMILQIAHNNGPEHVRMDMIEPKNELQVYKDLDVVDSFVDSWTPSLDFYANCADTFERIFGYMQERNEVMNQHPKRPKKLEKAREIALREGPLPDGSPHPLWMPFRFLIVEECAAVFADAISKEEREEQARILFYAAKLSQMARSAGIYVVCLTQYPTNASIPSIIRNNMRRIGLGCQNKLASRVVIDQNGLESIRTKGVGMMSADMGKYRKLRGFWTKDGDPDHGEQNDILEIVGNLPGKGGGSAISSNAWSGADPLIIPEPDSDVFSSWNKSTGEKLAKYIELEKQSPDRRP